MIQTVFAGRPGSTLVIALSFVLGLGTTGFAQADDFIPPLPRVRSAMERPQPFGPRDTDLLAATHSPGWMGAMYGAGAGGTIGAVLGVFLAGK